MKSFRPPPAGSRTAGPPPGRDRFGPDCTGRFVNPISDVCWECIFPDLDRADHESAASTGVLDTPNPSSPICLCGSPIPRIGLVAGGVGAGEAGRRDAGALVLPQPRRPHDKSRPAGRARAHRVLGRRRGGQGLGLARALLHVSRCCRGSVCIARPRLPRRAAVSTSPGPRSSTRPGSTTNCRSCSTPKPRCSPTCRPRPRAPPTARPHRWGCRSIRCSGVRAARAGCIR